MTDLALPLLVNALTSLPVKVAESDPRLCLARAWMLLVRGRPGAVEAEVRAAERGVLPGPLADGSSSVESSAPMVRTSARPILGDVSAALDGVTVASRTLYAPARDRILASALATVSHQTGTPVGAAKASMTLKSRCCGRSHWPAPVRWTPSSFPVTTGALSLLMAYALASVSVLRPYVLFCHLTPGPALPHGLFPYLVGGLARARAHGRGRTPASQRSPARS